MYLKEEIFTKESPKISVYISVIALFMYTVSEVILKWVNVTCQLEFKNRNWERLQNILLNGKPRALSMVKSQLA